jgi:uncharacterized protein YqgC (DUF456 family)
MAMSWIEIVLFVITLVVMLVGLAGVVLPLLPGVPIIFGAALVSALLTGFSSISGQTIIVFAILTVVSLVLDWVASVIGIKRMGGSYAGMIGAFIGMIVGLLLPGVGLVGFVIGAFVGAYAMELLFNKDSRVALRAGLGSFLGFLAGGLMKLVIGIIIIGVFVWQVLF